MKKIAALCFITVISPLLGFAHEGHGHTDGFTIKHYFVEPEHLAVLLCVVTALVFYFSAKRKKVPKGREES